MEWVWMEKVLGIRSLVNKAGLSEESCVVVGNSSLEICKRLRICRSYSRCFIDEEETPVYFN